MSVATEIERIKSAKENIINTLKANDIQIEENATIDEVDIVMNDVPILDTSDATATAEDILKDKTAYVNGEKIVGTLEATSGGGGNYNATLDTSKQTTLNLATAITEIDVLDCSNVTTLKSVFANNTSIKSINRIIAPNVKIATSMFSKSNIVTAPEIDTSNFTEMNAMFGTCGLLANVPIYNASNTTTLWNMFQNCPSLTDESLNNILAMCLTVTNPEFEKYNDGNDKQLKNIGLSSAQMGRCMKLPNWQAVLNAGWIRGD